MNDFDKLGGRVVNVRNVNNFFLYAGRASQWRYYGAERRWFDIGNVIVVKIGSGIFVAFAWCEAAEKETENDY